MVAVTLTLAGGLGRLEFDSSQDTMIPSASTVYSDYVRYQHQFGFVASGLTTTAGFGVLALSGFPLLSGFGVVVALYVVVALVCALTILPPLLAWTEARAPKADAPERVPAPSTDRVRAL